MSLTIDSAEDRDLKAWTAAAIRMQARNKVAKFLGSLHDLSRATVPMVQSQHSASGSVSSHALRAGR